MTSIILRILNQNTINTNCDVAGLAKKERKKTKTKWQQFTYNKTPKCYIQGTDSETNTGSPENISPQMQN